MLSRTCTDVHVCVPVWLCACMLSSLAFVCVSRTPPSAVAFVEAGVGFSWLFNKSQFCGQHTKLMRFTARTRGRGGLSRRGEREGSWAKRQRLPIARVEEKFISFILKISHSFPVSPASKRNVSLSLCGNGRRQCGRVSIGSELLHPSDTAAGTESKWTGAS